MLQFLTQRADLFLHLGKVGFEHGILLAQFDNLVDETVVLLEQIDDTLLHDDDVVVVALVLGNDKGYDSGYHTDYPTA